jgi:hypothetical protein
LHVVTAFEQSVHLDGMQEQRSKDPPSPGGGPASCGGVVVDDVDVDEVDVGGIEAVDVDAVDVVTGPVVAVVNVVVDVAGVVWPVDDDGGLVVMVETADVLMPRATPFAGSPPSAAHDVTPATSHAAHTNTRFRYMRKPAPSTSDLRRGESPGPPAR